MFGSYVEITTNVKGIPFFASTGYNIGTDSVVYSLGFRRIPAIGYMTISVDSLPSDVTGTLPVKFTLNGSTRPLTYFGGAPVTAADLQLGGIVTAFFNGYTGVFQIISPIQS